MISANLVRKLKGAKRAKLVNLASVLAGRSRAADLQTQVATADELAGRQPARSSRVVMNGWHAGGMRRVHDFGVSCLIRGVSGTLADSQIPKFRTEM